MSLPRLTLFAAGWFLTLVAVETTAFAAADTPDPLFQSDDILDVRITSPLTTLLGERPDEEELPGKLEFTDEAGTLTAFDVQLRTRGLFRRKKSVCRFPPLRINFKKSQTKNTLFDKQDKLKLVTHCQSSKRYEQVLLNEYIAYRILNIVSTTSFRVRLLRITYVDAEKKKDDIVKFGFAIEHRDRLAKRLQIPFVQVADTNIAALDPAYTNLVSVFHYLIGNTDFSPIQGPEDSMCCHNHVLFGKEGEPYWSIPYDFDQSGLVNAPHAVPNERFKIRSVRQRVYRGRCSNEPQLRTSLAVFLDKRDEIMQLIHSDGLLDARSQKSMASFVDKFYKTVSAEKRIQSEFIRACV